jgi:hypothetical protein
MDTHDAPTPRPAIRVSDADREAAAEQLRVAAADGRLELVELDDRLTAAYQAKTRAELAAVTADLESALPDTRPLTLRTTSGMIKRTGPWDSGGSIVNKVGGRPSPYTQTLRVSGSVHSGAIKARYPRRSFWDWLRGRKHPGVM